MAGKGVRGDIHRVDGSEKMTDKTDSKKLAEAALFMSTEPLSITQLSRVMDSSELGEAMDLMKELHEEFNSRHSSLEIVKTDDGCYRMQVRKEFLPSVKDFAANTDLSKALMRTLSLIAFKQPITQSVVAKARGNKAYAHIDELEESGFIKKVRKGHTFTLETTRKFDTYFQLPEKEPLGLPVVDEEIEQAGA